MGNIGTYIGSQCVVREVVNGISKNTGKVCGVFSGVQLGIPFETHKSNNDICIKMKGGKIKSYSNIHTLLKVTDYSWYFSSDTGVHEIVFVISW